MYLFFLSSFYCVCVCITSVSVFGITTVCVVFGVWSYYFNATKLISFSGVACSLSVWSLLIQGYYFVELLVVQNL